MGSSTQKSTSTSGPSNPDVNALISKLSKGIASEYTPGKSLYTAPSSATTGGWTSALSTAANPTYATSMRDAIASFGDTAAGKNIGVEAPGFARLRQNAIDDTMTSVNSAFNTSGLFGSDANMKAAGEGVANAIAGLDYNQYKYGNDQQAQAATLLPQLMQGALLPSSVQGSVGASMDADAAAKAAGPTDYLAKLTGIAAGNAQAGGTTTTTSTPSTPLWLSLLGAGVSLL